MHLILFVVALQLLGAESSRPLLTPSTEEVTFSANVEFELKCEADYPVTWNYTSRPSPMKKVVDHDHPDEKLRYFSTIHVENPNHIDVGYYYCIPKDGSGFDDKMRVGKIYVYIKDEDNFLATDDIIRMTIFHNAPFTLPCKPSFHGVHIELFNPIYELIQENGKTVTYDPRVGYTIASASILKNTGYHTCKGEWQGNELEVEYYVVVIPAPTMEQKPHINSTSEVQAHVGGTIIMYCSIEANPDAILQLYWIGPSNKPLENGTRITIEVLNENVVDKNGGRINRALRILRINPVTAEDKGNYLCRVNYHGRQDYNSSTTLVNVLDPNASVLNLTLDGTGVVYARVGDQVQWVIKVTAYPRPTFRLKAPHRKFVETTGPKYNITQTDTTLMVKVKDIVEEDAGTYVVLASNPSQTVSQNLILKIGSPAVSIRGIRTVYDVGKTYNVNCTVYASPKPTVKWFFQPCPTLDKCEKFRDITNKDNLVSSVYLDGKLLEAYRIQANESGHIKCYANNSRGNHESVATFVVSDVPGGFYVGKFPYDMAVKKTSNKSNILTYIEGDNVTLVCAANSFNYTSKLQWIKEVENSHFRIILKPGANADLGYNMHEDTSNYSYTYKLTFQNLSRKAAGNYICEVRHLIPSERSRIEKVNLNIKALTAPKMTNTNVKNGSVSVPAGTFDMHCFVTGVPTPKINWFKDGELLVIKPNQTKYTLYLDGQRLSVNLTSDDSGIYKCVAENRAGTAAGYTEIIIIETDSSITVLVVVIIVVVIAIIALVVAIAVLTKKMSQKKKLISEFYLMLSAFENGALERYDPEIPLDQQADYLPYDKRWEFPIDKLTLGKQLGAGAFGRVVQADADGIINEGIVTTVAVKMVNSRVDLTHLKSLVSELKIMSHLGNHLNIVNLLGACTSNLRNRELLMIVEFCPFGNLQKCLQRHRDEFLDQINPSTGCIDVEFGELMRRRRPSVVDGVVFWEEISSTATRMSHRTSNRFQDYRHEGAAVPLSPTATSTTNEDPICTSDLVSWAFQIAKGMEYLASRKVLHRDLAARNVLLCYDNIVKICDFGLAKEGYNAEYKKKTDGVLPIKWMALESMEDRVFSVQSDVWSFGILLWELFSLGQMPYPGIEPGPDLYRMLHDGYRMDKPKYATSEIYKLMLDCWKAKPNQRPNFIKLSSDLGNILDERVQANLLALNEPYLKMNEHESGYLNPFNKSMYKNLSAQEPNQQYQNVSGATTNSEYLAMASPTTKSPQPAEHPSGYFWMKGADEAKENTVAYSLKK